MKFTRMGTSYLVVIWGLVFFLLALMLFFGYRRNVASLEQLMASEARTLMDIVAVSSESSIRALEEVEYLTAERLLDNAVLLDRIAHPEEIPETVIEDIASTNRIYRFTLLNENGTRAPAIPTNESAQNAFSGEDSLTVESVLRGDRAVGIIGFTNRGIPGSNRYGVALGRAGGGAVIVEADPERMLEFRQNTGIGAILRNIGSREGVRYMVLQDTLGIVAASGGITEMTRIADDQFLLRAYGGASDSRMIRDSDGRILEAVRPLTIGGERLGLLRIGLSTAAADSIRNRAFRQFLILLIAAAISGAFLVVYVVLRQNYLLLDAEHDRILHDVRIMEEEHRRSERLTSMGRLAGGVAHEIRNPLNAVSIIAQRLKAEFTPIDGQDEYVSLLTTVRSEIARIGAIVEAFLRSARPPELTFSRENLAEIISGAANVLAEKSRLHHIALTVDAEPGLELRCDPDQFRQALLNVILNAIEAAGEKGAVSIRAFRKTRETIIEITDTGPGIPDTVLPNIFDPYFTTKDGGTGLGLSEVHRIITAHGGRIFAGNHPGGGAVFTVVMPEREGKDRIHGPETGNQEG